MFENCPRRVEEWRKFQKEDKKNRALFPFPCLSKWGTLLDAACYINQYWISLKQCREEKEHTESSATAEVCQEMEKAEIIESVGFLSTFEFLVGYFKESEATDFSNVRANVHLGKISEKLIELKKLELI